MNTYKAILVNGQTITVSKDKARSEYEYVKQYGLQAILARVSRTRIAKQLVAEGYAGDTHYVVKTIICPNGEEVTQF